MAVRRRDDTVLINPCRHHAGMLRERTKAGLDASHPEGRVGGRPVKLSKLLVGAGLMYEQRTEIVRMFSKGTRTAAEATRLFRVHSATVSRLLAGAQVGERRRRPDPELSRGVCQIMLPNLCKITLKVTEWKLTLCP